MKVIFLWVDFLRLELPHQCSVEGPLKIRVALFHLFAESLGYCEHDERKRNIRKTIICLPLDKVNAVLNTAIEFLREFSRRVSE